MNTLIVIMLWIVTVAAGCGADFEAFRAHDQLDHGIVNHAKSLLKHAWILTCICLGLALVMLVTERAQLRPPALTGLTLSTLALLMISQAGRRLTQPKHTVD